MKRGSGPRANPEKTRQWQQRSAARAAEKQREGSQTGARPGKQTVTHKGRSPKVPGQIGRNAPPPPPKPGRVEFRGPPLVGRSCAQCLVRGKSRKAAAWHHWLGQQHIRRYVDAQRIRDDGAERALTRRLIHDERNLSPMCWDCHDAHENVANGPKFPEDLVPDSARIFAAELGPWYVVRLEHDYV